MELKTVLRHGALILLGSVLAILMAQSHLHPLNGAPIGFSVVTGLALLGLLGWQTRILFTRMLGADEGAPGRARHRVVGTVCVGVFLLHVTARGENWTLALWLCFVLVALSSLLGRSQVRFRRRGAFMAQYAVHGALGLALVALGFWHGVVAVAFE